MGAPPMPSGRLGRKRRKARRAVEQHGIRVMTVRLPAELEQDAKGGPGRAALLEQADGLVEVDAHVRRESFGVGARVAGAFQLVDAPLDDVVMLRWVRDLEPRHRLNFPG